MNTQRTISVIPLAELEKLAKAARALRDDLDAFVVAHEARFREPDTKSALLHAKRNADNAVWSINRVVENEGNSFATHLKDTAVALATAAALRTIDERAQAGDTKAVALVDVLKDRFKITGRVLTEAEKTTEECRSCGKVKRDHFTDGECMYCFDKDDYYASEMLDAEDEE